MNITQAMTLLLLSKCLVHPHLGLCFILFITDPKNKIDMTRDEFLWVEKYRPKTIEDCILPKEIKKTFVEFLSKGEVPNLLLAGPAGCGKTTIAKALCNELGVDVYVINGSDEGRFLDTVRNNAKNFASTVSLTSTAKHKVIIIDEADNTTHDVQLLLRAFTEEFAGNCRFIFTCNYKTKSSNPPLPMCSGRVLNPRKQASRDGIQVLWTPPTNPGCRGY